VELGLKDVGHMRDLAAQVNAPLPLADLAFNHLLAARANGQGHLDWGAIALSIRREAGVTTSPEVLPMDEEEGVPAEDRPPKSPSA
jgi:hypothetical protein